MFDLIIIGSGPAGLSAGIYAGRYKLKTLIIGEMPGGIITQSHLIENYPGYESISGIDLMVKFAEHANKSGVEIMQEKIVEVGKNGNNFILKTSTGKILETKTILIATGNKYRKLGVPGEKEFLGAGVSYCATCDGMFFRNKDVVVVGGGNTAITEALYLAEICNKVHIVHRRDQFRAEEIRLEKAKNHEKIEMHLNNGVEEIKGNGFVEEIVLKNGEIIKAGGIFIAVGNEPDTSVFDSLNLEKDENGYIKTKPNQATSCPGIFAAGDISTGSNKFKQVIMAAAEGSLAADSVHNYLQSLRD
ncbi:MAG: thioredoxin-disulfide reductase [Candidatus Gracilibacteria bacterium]|nr:thioredoxin-disulfide reductase [Candidatus Gracilibacteria bacterium]MDD3120403.1 thioredoxin-disulfide reductase [Candidatus Gracilibacteria bacterium]